MTIITIAANYDCLDKWNLNNKFIKCLKLFLVQSEGSIFKILNRFILVNQSFKQPVLLTR